MKNITKKQITLLAKILAVSLSLAILAGMELAVRVFSPPSHLESIIAVLRRDPVLFWRNRSGLDTTFAETRVVTDSHGFRVPDDSGKKLAPKKNGSRRIVCMGASPTFGWGVEYADTYSSRLEALLNESGESAEVINAGMIGYSSHQGKILLETEIAALAPDVITASYVINDIDKYRFFRTDGRPDRELQPESAALTYIRDILDRSRFFHAYEKTVNRAAGRRTSFDGKPVSAYRPGELRVPPEQYRENLEEIISIARDRGIEVILVKMPVNLPVAADVPEALLKEAEALSRRGGRLAEDGDCEKAVEALQSAVEKNPNQSEAYYYLGVCGLRSGNKKAAEKAFSEAFESEARRCGKDGKIFNGVMEEGGKRRGVPVADAAAAFAARSGEYLFISPETDPIHPNAKGHAIIAEVIFEKLSPPRR